MLSTETPPDPSCSPCKIPTPLKSDERTPPPTPPERLAFSDQADPEADTHLSPHFSIRDYVFTSRNKDIGVNWPFPEQYLHLCLKHGVKDLLPPFEPPDSLRVRFSSKSGGSAQLIVCSEDKGTRAEVNPVERDHFSPVNGESAAIAYKFCLPTDKLALESSDQFQGSLPEDNLPVTRGVSSHGELIHIEAENESTVTSRDQIGSIPSPVSVFLQSVQETRSISGSPIEGEVAGPCSLLEKTEGLRRPSEKKCKLILKLGTVPEPSRTEDIGSISSSVSDPMASKVCPVCKTFSSTSNTTLNAHIDQCLSVESSTKRATTKFPKHKVKPKKKRSMVDICATAPRCTLEDLDKRNGSNWALDLTLVAPASETCTTGNKRPRLSPVNPLDDESEGAVYVDSNGTKLRILSRFNDAQPASALEDSNPTKFKKLIKDGKRISTGKKKHLSHKYMKYMKVKPQSKKLRSFKPSEGEIHTATVGRFHMDTHQQKDDGISQTSTAQDQTRGSEPATLRQWVCSKRSGLSKKVNKVVSHRSPRNPEATALDPLIESNQSASGDSSALGSNIFRSSMPSGNFASFPKIKSIDILSNTAHSVDYGEKHSQHPPEKFRQSMGNTSSTSKGLMLKLSRSSGSYIPSARSKSVELHASVKSLPLRSSENFHPLSPKAKRSSTVRKNLPIERLSFLTEANECHEVGKVLISKKLRKRRSVEKTGKHGGRPPSDVNEGFQDSPIVSDLGSANNNQISGTYKSTYLENIMGSDTTDIVDQVSPSPGNALDSEQGKKAIDIMENTHIMERGKCLTPAQFQPVTECRLLDLTNVNSQVNVSANVVAMVKSSMEEAVGSPIASDDMASEDHTADTCANLDTYRSLKEQIEPVCNAEARVDPRIPKPFDNHVLHGGGGSTDEIGVQNIQMAAQIESIEKVDSFSELQNAEYRTDTASIQGSNFCWTSPGNSILEVPHENSSVTSVRIVPAQDYYVGIYGEPSESPVSAASTISHRSMEDLKLKDSKTGPPVEHVAAVPGNLSPDYSSSLVPPFASMREKERTDFGIRDQESNVTVQVHVPENILNKQPCCCSRRESISCESQPSSQSIMAGMMLPSKAKQMTSNLYIRPVMPSLHGTCSMPRTQAVVLPFSDSYTVPVSLKASSDLSIRFPTYTDFGASSPSCQTQPQSTSSPILRLMGKNLLVVNKKEEEPVVPQKQAVPCSSTDNPNAYLSLLGFSSTCSVSNQGSPLYCPHQSLEDSTFVRQVPSNAHQVSQTPPTMWIDSFGTVPLQNGLKNKMDPQAHPKRLNKNPSSPFASNLERVSYRHQCQNSTPVAQIPIPAREVIVIDDTTELEAEPKGSLLSPASTLPPPFSGSNLRPARPFACFLPPNPFQLREIPRGQMPGFPLSSPRANANSTRRGSTSEASGPPLPNPFAVLCLSAGQVTPMPYYSPSLQ